uniref:Uncharacterized protein n=1 Tax=Physcomitrium patens TaxID=3218 RepID=A0A2K1K9R8_PHYPA|nr:hypothetical protein PHYPA_009714 [Physcomitrium patens]
MIVNCLGDVHRVDPVICSDSWTVSSAVLLFGDLELSKDDRKWGSETFAGRLLTIL